MHSIESTERHFDWRHAARSWWPLGTIPIAAGSVLVAIDTIAHDPGLMWKRAIGFTLLTFSAALAVAGLIVRCSSPAIGSTMVAIGVIPGNAPIVLFWFLPAIVIAVFVGAVNGATDARRSMARQHPP